MSDPCWNSSDALSDIVTSVSSWGPTSELVHRPPAPAAAAFCEDMDDWIGIGARVNELTETGRGGGIVVIMTTTNERVTRGKKKINAI